MRFKVSLLTAGAALLSPVLAQTWTDCNPMNVTCPADPALGIAHEFVFNSSSTVTDAFNVTNGALTYGTQGTEFTVAKRLDSPTIQSKFYIFFGSVSVIMKAAKGQGIISSIVLESDDLDEVDWEFMGGNITHAETNYFGKGNTTSFDRAVYYPVATDVTENFHNYTIHWTSDTLEWYIDSALVRTLPYAAANGGHNYPQTPMTVRLGIWAGGDTANNNGTIVWAGGLTDYSKGPYTMYVQSAQVNDFGGGKEYVWGDKSGSWQSIKTVTGNSTVATTILAVNTPKPTIAEKWAAMSSGTKLAIYCGAGGGAALLFSLMLCTCIRQRRKGKKEREAYNAQVEKEREDAYKDQMELREKGLGGWDQGAYASQGEDALGGWGGTHVPAGQKEKALEAANVHVEEVPSRNLNATPTLPRVGSPAPLLRQQTNASFGIASPQPQSPRINQGGLIQNASQAYTGGYRGPPTPTLRSPERSYSSNSNQNQGYANSNQIPRSPSFPLGSGNGGGPQAGTGSQRGYGSNASAGGRGGWGGDNGGYSRF